jgi:hypothetical protein
MSIQIDLDNNVRSLCIPVPITSSRDFSPFPAFPGVENFTIFLGMRPNFPGLEGKSLTSGGETIYSANYSEIYTRHYNYQRSVENCLYDKTKDPYCPRFLIGDIVKNSGGNFGDAAGLVLACY